MLHLLVTVIGRVFNVPIIFSKELLAYGQPRPAGPSLEVLHFDLSSFGDISMVLRILSKTLQVIRARRPHKSVKVLTKAEASASNFKFILLEFNIY